VIDVSVTGLFTSAPFDVLVIVSEAGTFVCPAVTVAGKLRDEEVVKAADADETPPKNTAQARSGTSAALERRRAPVSLVSRRYLGALISEPSSLVRYPPGDPRTTGGGTQAPTGSPAAGLA
jgi:hypothetical protein